VRSVRVSVSAGAAARTVSAFARREERNGATLLVLTSGALAKLERTTRRPTADRRRRTGRAAADHVSN
jgi:hypothetical protein